MGTRVKALVKGKKQMQRGRGRGKKACGRINTRIEASVPYEEGGGGERGERYARE